MRISRYKIDPADFMAREIVGRESAAVSRHYTHLSTDDLRNAMQLVAGRDERVKQDCYAVSLLFVRAFLT